MWFSKKTIKKELEKILVSEPDATKFEIKFFKMKVNSDEPQAVGHPFSSDHDWLIQSVGDKLRGCGISEKMLTSNIPELKHKSKKQKGMGVHRLLIFPSILPGDDNPYEYVFIIVIEQTA